MKLYCTFCKEEYLESNLKSIQQSYNVLNNKIFVLYSNDNNEFICSYNIDPFNINELIDGTILMHRKKSVLYTINGLNCLIKKLNNGVLNENFKIQWDDYQNCILLTQNNELKILNTKLVKIISF